MRVKIEEDVTIVSMNLMLPISKGGNGQKLVIGFCRSDLRAFVFVQQRSQQKMVASYVSSIRHPRGYTAPCSRYRQYSVKSFQAYILA